jgi:hypothetical protein
MENLQANELRIGNWVEHNQPKRGYYTTVQKSTFSVNVEKLFKPIPITERWLLSFGFQKGRFDYLKNNLEISKLNNGIFDAYCTDLESSVFISEIKYVHQLQNLYFALTGEELTINEL